MLLVNIAVEIVVYAIGACALYVLGFYALHYFGEFICDCNKTVVEDYANTTKVVKRYEIYS